MLHDENHSDGGDGDKTYNIPFELPAKTRVSNSSFLLPPTDGLPTDGLPTDGLPTDGPPTDGLPTDGQTAKHLYCSAR